MFTVDNYRVSFRHDQSFDDNVPVHVPNIKGITVCTVLNQETNYLTQGVGFCSKFDQFNKAVGRKVALTRALKPFDKETRTKFWNAYFEAQGSVK